MDQSDQGGQVFVASALVWCKDRGLLVHLMFEGHPEMRSQMGQATALHTFETAAQIICLSVE
jgi:hypothetical protein